MKNYSVSFEEYMVKLARLYNPNAEFQCREWHNVKDRFMDFVNTVVSENTEKVGDTWEFKFLSDSVTLVFYRRSEEYKWPILREVVLDDYAVDYEKLQILDRLLASLGFVTTMNKFYLYGSRNAYEEYSELLRNYLIKTKGLGLSHCLYYVNGCIPMWGFCFPNV